MTKVLQYLEKDVGPYRENNNSVCGYCKRRVYFDNWHYYVNKNGEEKPVSHDRSWKLGLPIPRAHWDHCPVYQKILHDKDTKEMNPPKPGELIDTPKPEIIDEKYNQKIDNLLAEQPISNERYGVKFPEIPKNTDVDIGVIIQQTQRIELLEQDIRTLQVQHDHLTKAFNDYVEVTIVAMQKLAADIHNGYVNPERVQATLETYLDDVKKKYEQDKDIAIAKFKHDVRDKYKDKELGEEYKKRGDYYIGDAQL